MVVGSKIPNKHLKALTEIERV